MYKTMIWVDGNLVHEGEYTVDKWEAIHDADDCAVTLLNKNEADFTIIVYENGKQYYTIEHHE